VAGPADGARRRDRRVLPVTTFYARDVAAEMAGKGATDVAF
jgi:hypothetical protein